MAFAFLVLAFAAGGALPVQAGINSRLAGFVGGPIRASMISFAAGTVVLVAIALVFTRGLVSTDRLGGVLYRQHHLSAGRIAGVVLLAAGVALVRFF